MSTNPNQNTQIQLKPQITLSTQPSEDSPSPLRQKFEGIEQEDSHSGSKLKRSKYYLRIDDVKDEAALLCASKYTTKLSDQDTYQESTKEADQDDSDCDKFYLTTDDEGTFTPKRNYISSYSAEITQNQLKPLLQKWRNQISL